MVECRRCGRGTSISSFAINFMKISISSWSPSADDVVKLAGTLTELRRGRITDAGSKESLLLSVVEGGDIFEALVATEPFEIAAIESFVLWLVVIVVFGDSPLEVLRFIESSKNKAGESGMKLTLLAVLMISFLDLVLSVLDIALTLNCKIGFLVVVEAGTLTDLTSGFSPATFKVLAGRIG
jgi:hypothetical protein